MMGAGPAVAVPPPSAISLEDLQTGVLHLCDAGRVVAANASARALLADGLRGRAPDFILSMLQPGRDFAFDGEFAGQALRCVGARSEQGWVVELVPQGSGAGAVDSLTGLADRRGLRERLRIQLSQLGRSGPPFAIHYIDLDRFKSVNDTLGHPVGDELLKRVAERLRKAARTQDVIARLGGDEFAIVQCNVAGPVAAEALAARIVDLVGRAYIVDGHMLHVGASVGVAMAPTDGSDVDSLLRNADLALYRAKAEGRGVFRFFEPGMNDSMQARRALEIDLRRALAIREFDLAFQPQVQAADGRVVGFEALIRWPHETRGLVSPADFIPLAEEVGLIGQIGEWVLRTACATAANWPEHISIAVNVSPSQVRSGKLVETVVSALARSSLAPSRLELEITEGALLENTEAVLEVLHALRDLGVRISMDDFGTGYSSLSYLQKFPFTKIKIDQSFVRRLEEHADAAAIVRAVAALGASLGIKTTAEGVETESQRRRIISEGCTELQGYLTGRPMPAEAAAALIASHPFGSDAS